MLLSLNMTPFDPKLESMTTQTIKLLSPHFTIYFE